NLRQFFIKNTRSVPRIPLPRRDCRVGICAAAFPSGGRMSTLSYSAIISERSQNGREVTPSRGVRSKFSVRGVSFWYGDKQALFDITVEIPERAVMALIGP